MYCSEVSISFITYQLNQFTWLSICWFYLFFYFLYPCILQSSCSWDSSNEGEKEVSCSSDLYFYASSVTVTFITGLSNCQAISTAPPAGLGFFAHQVQAQMRHFYQLWAYHGQDIFRMDLCSTFQVHCQFHTWNHTCYYWKHTNKWNFLVIAEPNWGQFSIYSDFTSSTAWIEPN